MAAELGAGEVVEPEFSLYRRHLAEVRAGAGRWRSNPSNPLGRSPPPTTTPAVWDEAFWPLATGTWTRGDDAAWRLGSLTKLWACPGLRLGYVIAPDAAPARPASPGPPAALGRQRPRPRRRRAAARRHRPDRLGGGGAPTCARDLAAALVALGVDVDADRGQLAARAVDATAARRAGAPTASSCATAPASASPARSASPCRAPDQLDARDRRVRRRRRRDAAAGRRRRARRPLLGEPPARGAPGRLVRHGRCARVERAPWRDRAGRRRGARGGRRRRGVALAGVGLRRAPRRRPVRRCSPRPSCVAGRMLDDEAHGGRRPARRRATSPAARDALRSLVGRDPPCSTTPAWPGPSSSRSPRTRRDAVVAPALWAAVRGAPAVLAHRAVNTLDAMVGHRSARYQRFGWASARLDDVANAVPAVVGVALVAARHPSPAGAPSGAPSVVDAAPPPVAERRRSSRPRSPARSASRSAAPTATATPSRTAAGSAPGRRPVARRHRPRRAAAPVRSALAPPLVLLARRGSALGVRRRPSRRSQRRLVSSSQPTASARRSVVAT